MKWSAARMTQFYQANRFITKELSFFWEKRECFIVINKVNFIILKKSMKQKEYFALQKKCKCLL